MTKLTYYFLFIFLVSIFTSCDNDDADVSKPEVSSYSLNGEMEGVTVAPGEELDFEAVFSDNKSLKEYQIEIHDDFDGHSHGRLATPWSYKQTFPLSGSRKEVHQHVEVPETAATGPYHFIVNFIDEDGNEGEFIEIDFEIIDAAEQPVIEILSPDFSVDVEVTPGSTITVVGTVTDPDGLADVHITMMEEEEDGHGHRIAHEEPLIEWEASLNGNPTSFDLNTTLTIPVGAKLAHYDLAFMAKDVKGNVKVVKKEILLK